MIILPHQSLNKKGFVWVIAITAGLIVIPLIAVMGHVVFWVLLPFVLAAIWGLWVALQKSWKDRAITEALYLWPDLIAVTRKEPTKTHHWQANPYWVRAHLHQTGGPVETYLTLTDGKREIELGAFLTPAERVDLKYLIETYL